MQLTGIHHLTAITAKPKYNVDFYTRTLGLRLVKKTVNQDDVSSYHLFYADGLASPGTDITFFDWPAAKEHRGTRSIVRTGFRIASASSLQFWKDRLGDGGLTVGEITERDCRPTLQFEDAEGQRLSLIAGEDGTEAHPWGKSAVPTQHQIRGLGPITISVPILAPTQRVLTDVMGMRNVRRYAAPSTDGGSSTTEIHVFEMGNGGPAAELHVAVEPGFPAGRLGAGAVHHVAFRIPTFEEYDQWASRLNELGVGNSGPVDRFYFRSLYFREPNGILFELATDGPGFASDENMEHLGEKLALPPFLEPRRAAIEAGLKPI